MDQMLSAEEGLLGPKETEKAPSFFKKLAEIPSCEEKLRSSIHFMKEALSQVGSPHLRDFWEVRRLCLPLFKEELAPPVRTLLWEEYIALTREGRRLKNLLDEETSFAIEQMEIAIQAVEEEVAVYPQKANENFEKNPFPASSQFPKALEQNIEKFQRLQAKLDLLNVYALRVNDLRKELIKTDMRIRQKNALFGRLSVLGDAIFPPRKELIKEIGELFAQDIQSFLDAYFAPQTFRYEKMCHSVFFFREEIKSLQAIAKIFTINTQVFTKTRQQLSECWDKLRGMEKELKKEYSEQKQKSMENCLLVRAKIQEAVRTFEQNSTDLEQASKQFDEILRFMKGVELIASDVRALKDELRKAREPLYQKQDEEEAKRQEKGLAEQQKRNQQIQELKEAVERLQSQVATLTVETLEKEVETLKNQLIALPLPKVEKGVFEKALKKVRDLIEEKKEQTFLDLSDSERATLENLTLVLDQRKQRRKEVKAQIEEYRKILGGSTLDFEKAILYNDLMNTEKERLEKIDEGIEEIDQKIIAFKRR